MTPAVILAAKAAVDERLAQVDGERATLMAISDGYARLLALTQPERVGISGSQGSPAPAAPRAGAVREGRTPTDQAGERGFDTRPPLQSTDCPSCGRTFAGAHGLSVHVARIHPRPATLAIPAAAPFTLLDDEEEPIEPEPDPEPVETAPSAAPAAPPKPPWSPTPVGVAAAQLPAGAATSYLCERCPERFTTRQELAEHRRGHPPVPPAREPMRSVGGLLTAAVGMG